MATALTYNINSEPDDKELFYRYLDGMLYPVKVNKKIGGL